MPIARYSRLLQRSEGHKSRKRPARPSGGRRSKGERKEKQASYQREGQEMMGSPMLEFHPQGTHTGQSKPPFFLEKRNTSMHVLTIRTLWLTHMSVADDHELERENKR
ncbi:hypothetical protein PVAP13_8KG345101 [Panicum virgatum]|uniref:Uncharacterized protein n=1 Tax=Panicum virgatum TaxID=38727 RepID=A0A8T0PP49_PANVG|nr:hypothetical protein PVAP13_8KG345101 [Panicum virgatum]